MNTEPRFRFRFWLALSSSLWLAACAGAAGGASAAAGAEGLAAQIRQEIGDATCTSSAQCRTLAIGHKACGGPEAYWPWSTAVSDEKRLNDLGTRYAAARRTEVQQSGQVSNCMLVTDPGARCEAGRCVPAGRSPAVM